MADALRIKLLVTGGLCAVLAAVAGPVADAYGVPELEWPLRLMAVAVFGQSLLQLYDQIFEAHRRVALYLRIAAAESVMETVSSIALVLAGFGVTGAMAGRAGAYVFAAGLGLALLVGRLGIRPTLANGGGNVRRLVGYGSALLVIDGAFVLFHRIDVLLIGAILSVEAVGQFDAPLRLMTMLGYVGAAVASGIAPRLAAGRDRLDPRRWWMPCGA